MLFTESSLIENWLIKGLVTKAKLVWHALDVSRVVGHVLNDEMHIFYKRTWLKLGRKKLSSI